MKSSRALMPTMEDTANATTYERSKPEGQPGASRNGDQTSAESKDNSHVSGTTLMLATAGSATGGAFLGGTLTGNPIGVIGGAAVGILLGVLLKRSTTP